MTWSAKAAKQHVDRDQLTREQVNILLVDDDPTILLLIAEGLADDGYNVMTAGDGFAALDVLARPTTRVDFLITDVGLPRLGGYELAKAGRVLRPNLNILLITGRIDSDLSAEMQNDQRIAVLLKPFSLKELTFRIQVGVG
jgi:DNA-binding response OmpR family regulator